MSLTADQQGIISMYVEQRTLLNQHITRLNGMVQEIDRNIANIVATTISPVASSNPASSSSATASNNPAPAFSTRFHAEPLTYIYTDIINFDPTQTANSLLSAFLNSTVPIAPTNEELDRASQLVRYGDLNQPVSRSCPISLEEFGENDPVRQLVHCRHLFSPDAFQTWFQTHVRCPVCRHDIRT